MFCDTIKIKHIFVYLIDIDSHSPMYCNKNNIAQSKDIINEKIHLKRIQRDDENLSVFCIFGKISIEKSLSRVNYGRKNQNKIYLSQGLGSIQLFQKFWGSGGLDGPG